MNLVVWGTAENVETLTKANIGANWIHVHDLKEILDIEAADAYFLLDEKAMKSNLGFTEKPVFVNSVIETLQENNMPPNVLRMNGWNGFLEKTTWEMAGNLSVDAENILKYINKQSIFVPDTIGMISAPVIALIINEAYYAESAGVSTQQDIDTAMKLGTNYPFGPFEWGEKIGIHEIYSLLKKLSEKDPRYIPAPALQKITGY